MRLLPAQLVIAHALDQEVEAALMRKVLELDAAGADGGIGVVGENIAASHLDRIDAEPICRLIDQVFAHGIADRVADRTVLRTGWLVQIHDGGTPPVMSVAIGPA